jgi:hypothetical protein
MADSDGITTFQSFTERTLKYGRNLMAASVPILVFAWVEVVDLANSSPFNFEIKPGGEIWIWRLLLALLVYYSFRFYGLAIPDLRDWRLKHGEDRARLTTNLNNQIKNEKDERDTLAREYRDYDASPNPSTPEQRERAMMPFKATVEEGQKRIRNARSQIRDYNWRRTYFWLADAGLPTALFGLALLAGIGEINRLMNAPVCVG